MKLDFSVTSCVEVRWTASDSLLECGGPAPLWPQLRMRLTRCVTKLAQGAVDCVARDLGQSAAGPWPGAALA